jgi:hypothetical protein
MDIDDPIQIFDESNSDGSGNYGRLWKILPEIVNYTNLKDIDFNDRIAAMYVHPRMNVFVHEDADYRGRMKSFFGTGVVTNATLNSLGLRDKISSMYAYPEVSFDKWKLQCCRNEITDRTNPTKCGKYWSQDPAQCGNMDCADKLMTDGVCQTWCRKFPNNCDTLKRQYCQAHSDAPQCGCIFDTEAARNQRLQYPSITAPRQCWSASECQKTDLVDTLIPTDMQTNNCPDVNSQIQTQIIRDSTIIGSNLSMEATQTVTKVENTPAPQTSAPATTTIAETNNNAVTTNAPPSEGIVQSIWQTYFLWIVILLIIVGAAVIVGFLWWAL